MTTPAKKTTPARKSPAKPQDRKPPAVKAEATMADLTLTYEGVEYTIKGSNVDNVELFEMVEEGRMLSAIKGFVGADQWAKFKDSARLDDGRVPMSATEGFLNEVMGIVGNLNASRS